MYSTNIFNLNKNKFIEYNLVFLYNIEIKKILPLQIEILNCFSKKKYIGWNYEILPQYFPNNTKEGFKTEALPIIWEDKENFNNLMKKASNDMIKLAATIEDVDDIGGAIKKLMWSNCKACHNKYREEH